MSDATKQPDVREQLRELRGGVDTDLARLHDARDKLTVAASIAERTRQSDTYRAQRGAASLYRISAPDMPWGPGTARLWFGTIGALFAIATVSSLNGGIRFALLLIIGAPLALAVLLHIIARLLLFPVELRVQRVVEHTAAVRAEADLADTMDRFEEARARHRKERLEAADWKADRIVVTEDDDSVL